MSCGRLPRYASLVARSWQLSPAQCLSSRRPLPNSSVDNMIENSHCGPCDQVRRQFTSFPTFSTVLLELRHRRWPSSDSRFAALSTASARSLQPPNLPSYWTPKPVIFGCLRSPAPCCPDHTWASCWHEWASPRYVATPVLTWPPALPPPRPPPSPLTPPWR